MKTLFSSFTLLVILTLVGLQVTYAVNCGNTDSKGPGTPPTPPPCEGAGANLFKVSTGNVSREILDLEVHGGVGEHKLIFKRMGASRYSGYKHHFGWGHQWNHSYNWALVTAGLDGNNQPIYEIQKPDGSIIRFYKVGSLWKPPGDLSSLIESPQEGRLVYRTADAWSYEFNLTSSGGSSCYRMDRFYDSQSNVYNFSYDSGSPKELIRVTEPSGRYLEIQYAWSNLIGVNSVGKTTTTLASIQTTPPENTWQEISLSNTQSFRYLLYRDTGSNYCRIAEIEFLDAQGIKIPGVLKNSGPGSTPARGPEKALDGDPVTYFEFHNNTFGFVALDLGANTTQVVKKIRYLPAPNSASSVLNGRFEGANTYNNAWGNRVITKVIANDNRPETVNREVSYTYGTLEDSTLGNSTVTLNAVTYGDGSQALYTYAQTIEGTQPLLVTASDPRYEGPGKRLRFDYITINAGPVGVIKSEKNLVTGTLIAQMDQLTANSAKVTYGNGTVDTFHFNPQRPANTVKLVNSLGQSTNYAYADASMGLYNQKVDPNGATTTTNSFTVLGNPLQKTYPTGLVETITRDAKDRVMTQTLTPPGGGSARVTSYERDSLGRVTKITYPDASFETWSYNSFSQILSHRARNAAISNYSYDTRGLLTSKSDALGSVSSYTYNADDRLASVVDPRGLTSSWLYNWRGQITRLTNPDASFVSMTYDFWNNKLTQSNELGATWSWTYDEFGRATAATDPLNRVTLTSYGLGLANCGSCHTQANPTAITLPSGKKITYNYDLAWRRTSQTLGADSAEAATTSYSYDVNGNLITSTDALGRVSSIEYDIVNRKTQQRDPLGNQTNWSYDVFDNVLTMTRPDAGVTTNTYDSVNQLLTTRNPKLETTTLTYDDGGNLLSLTDAKSNTYSFTYDLLSRKTRMNYPNPGSGVTFEAWAYNDTATAGNVWSVYTGRDGTTMSCKYDNRGRETFCDYSAANTPDVTKTYDAVGRLLTAGSSSASYVYTYDAANQLLSEQSTYPGLATSLSVSYTYNSDGHRASLTYPDGSVVTSSYTNRNQLKAIQAGGPPPLATYTYDLNGNRIGKNLENGTVTSYSYDNASRLTQMKHTMGVTTLAQFDYTLNNVGNRTTKNATGSIPNRNESYTYDAIDQVTGTTATGTNPNTQTFAYDAAGNRTAVGATNAAPGTGTYTTNALNQYTALGAEVLLYDINGNLTTQGLSASYSYDSKNRLIGASKGTETMSATYDYQNRQVSRTMNNGVSYFIYDGWNLIGEYTANGSMWQKHIHGAATDEILAKTDWAGTFYYHHDGLGSTVALTNSSGNVIESYLYDVYGKPTVLNASNTVITASAFGNRFLFTGREWIRRIEIYDYRNRVYSPDLGRFLQTDPIRFDAGDGNIYRYVFNTPVNWVDPLGLQGGTYNQRTGGSANPGMNAYQPKAPSTIAKNVTGGIAAGAVAGSKGGAPGAIIGAKWGGLAGLDKGLNDVAWDWNKEWEDQNPDNKKPCK